MKDLHRILKYLYPEAPEGSWTLCNDLPQSPMRILSWNLEEDAPTQEVITATELPLAKESKWEEVKSSRDYEESFGPFSYNGHTFQNNDKTRTNLLGTVVTAMVLGLQDDQIVDYWTTEDNTVIPVTLADAKAMGFAAREVVSNAHEKGRILRQTIEDATSIEEIEAITWESVT